MTVAVGESEATELHNGRSLLLPQLVCDWSDSDILALSGGKLIAAREHKVSILISTGSLVQEGSMERFRLKEKKMQTACILRVALLTVTLVMTTDIFVSPVSAANSNCVVGSWVLNVTTHHCWEELNVRVCYGMCLSLEYGVLKYPYIVGIRQVCGHTRSENIMSLLTNCQPGYSPEQVVLPHAVNCSCKRCDPRTTLCG